jgi:hypothetical protein
VIGDFQSTIGKNGDCLTASGNVQGRACHGL